MRFRKSSHIGNPRFGPLVVRDSDFGLRASLSDITDPVEPWGLRRGGRKNFLLFSLCLFWIQGWDRITTRKIVKRRDAKKIQKAKAKYI